MGLGLPAQSRGPGQRAGESSLGRSQGLDSALGLLSKSCPIGCPSFGAATLAGEATTRALLAPHHPLGQLCKVFVFFSKVLRGWMRFDGGGCSLLPQSQGRCGPSSQQEIRPELTLLLIIPPGFGTRQGGIFRATGEPRTQQHDLP